MKTPQRNGFQQKLPAQITPEPVNQPMVQMNGMLPAQMQQLQQMMQGMSDLPLLFASLQQMMSNTAQVAENTQAFAQQEGQYFSDEWSIRLEIEE